MILGLFDGHNSSSSIIKENNIVYASSEERFTRKKNFRGFPINSINYGLNLKENSENLSAITVGGIFRKGERLKNIKELQKKLEVPMYYFNHHLCHAALYKLSGFKECLILTMDGGGDGFSSTVSIGKKDKIENLAQSDLIDSVGDFYASITELLGFKPMEDEGKVMSLSGYASEDILKNLDIIDYDEKTKTFKNYMGVIGYESTKSLQRIFSTSNDKNIENSTKYEISKFAQNKLEEVVLKLIKQFVTETGISNIVFSGGVSQNVKLNKKIIEQDYVSDLYIPPFSGDEGLSIGSSILFSKKNDFNLKNTYLGYEIKNNNIENILNTELKEYDVKYVENSEIPETIGELISSNNIVCVSRGKMEFGPRALGNRSILALPTKENAVKISKSLKRDSFMPYAPTILQEYSNDYFINPKNSPYMTMLFDVFNDKKSEIDGVIHVDRTTRAQTLTKEFNEVYYNILSTVNDLTKIPAVINTSFNLHGEPIVCTENDSVKSFKSVGNALLLGNYIIEKK